MEDILLLVVVYTLYDLGSNKRAFRDYAFQRNHVIQVTRAESSRIASVFAEAASIGAIVHL